MISGCLSRNVGILIVNKLIPEERHFVTVEKIHYILNRQSEKHFNGTAEIRLIDPANSSNCYPVKCPYIYSRMVLCNLIAFFHAHNLGIIITITIYPAFVKLSIKLGDRKS